MNKLKVMVLLVGLSGSVMADDYSGVYINLNAGAGDFTSSLPNWEAGGALNVGYNFNRYFALEVGDVILSGDQYPNTNTFTNVADIAAKGTLPLSNDFSIYGRLGLGIMTNSWGGTIYANQYPNCAFCQNNSNNSLVGLAGVGLAYSLSDSFELHVEDTFIAPTNTTFTGNINTVMLGLQYNFDRTKPAVTSVAPEPVAPPPAPEPTPVPEVVAPVAVVTTPVVAKEVKDNKCDYVDRKLDIKKDKRGRKYIEVKECDTLFFVAEKTKISMKKLKLMNHLHGDIIDKGTKLYISK